MQERLGKWLLSWPPLAYLVVFFLLPSLIMMFAAFRYPGDYGGLMPLTSEDPATGKLVLDITLDNWRDYLTLESFVRLVDEPLYIELFIKSLWYATLTTLICIAMGYPLAWLIARSPKKYRDLMLLLVILPFWSNFLIRIYAWMILLGPQSALSKAINLVVTAFGHEPVSLLFTPFAVIVCLVYVHLPFMVLPLYANLEKHDMALLDAAQDLGASAWQRFWKITWPLSLPGVYAGAALVFIPALGMFAVPDIIGGTEGIMIGNLIKQQFLETRDWPFGAVLSIMLTGGVLLMAGLAAAVGRGKQKAKQKHG
ncbi:ABC transporter permease [Rivihabitans pingtungensis]|mgnify:FL=1|jgi:spermidine/putrescine transport system permease protein|uniref:ABC-type spermidine/putrescine transport system permease subunit I n=2 Tax=Rivihabitans pingtungensis TaxID=1054498 RepID=A0A318KVE5_9NEIS|nr:ABC transporter permease [Rivihabitans pingtungensis]MCK6438167.1 ABC transporter permease [Rivihabitans pingtungensis]PXX80848.1 ABC-type spermidine/putrescine transport system permease subunit I [Rivihabitans pingtungensis]HNX70511.1 ABC transporter permease [Rivihabitans pingtungensis]